MKFKLRPLRSLYLIIIMIISFSAFSQNAGISATGDTPPNTAAGLDINFSNKGLLLQDIIIIRNNSLLPYFQFCGKVKESETQKIKIHNSSVLE